MGSHEDSHRQRAFQTRASQARRDPRVQRPDPCEQRRRAAPGAQGKGNEANAVEEALDS
jgi:hypothetical protein